ncbi:MAG: preprotein translocase subunit SecA [Deltaproteobacteria bacterium]|nr:preprotein translocase subunit SecA [Deltaproteobacteria bacterium]
MFFAAFARKIFGTRNDRELKRIGPTIIQINDLEAQIQKLSDTELQQKTFEFKSRLEKGETLNNLLPEAFAVCREASQRALGMRHYDCQLIGGMVLHEGKIAEMKTGEGKTLVATLAVYLNALEGKGVHVVTVNDYLAKRDSEWMGRLYRFLGLSVGNIVHGLNDEERRQNYAADITYGTNNEFGFDYLRDNMKFDLSQCVQRQLHYAVVDEVDSILIDEARTPLIISGPSEESTDKYARIDRIIPNLKAVTDYTIDEKSRTAVLIEEGVSHVEKLLNVGNLYEPENMELVHHVNQALRAHALYKRDVDYVVKEGEVIIVDEFTGRLMPGRRWSDGLHQAIEAKEKVTIENENQTLATISFQNYFRMYKKLSGMTGTADTEAAEFSKIYNLEVMVMPTNRAMIREDEADLIYKNEKGKFRAVINEIEECYKKGQPVLVGTISIEKSEELAAMLSRRGIPHHVLNAKQHEKEAEIVAQAGRFGALTISTNMAGRGTDILLGGNPEFLARSKVGKEAIEEVYQVALIDFKKQCEVEKQKVIEAGGLRILGTERHESRRIDNQLRGRAGRQGDPGSSRFYISLQDDLMRIFGSDRISSMMERLGMEEDEPIFHPWISKAIENAQKKVEAHNFDIRKNLIEFDDVMNQQRSTVYKLRNEILSGLELKEKVTDFVDQHVDALSQEFQPAKGEEWNWRGLEDRLYKTYGFWYEELKTLAPEVSSDEVGEKIYNKMIDVYEEREKQYTPAVVRHIERIILLQTLDTLWKDHLLNMDHLREGIGLRGYAQKDPIIEYKKEGFRLFENMMLQLAEDSLEKLYRVQISLESRDPNEGNAESSVFTDKLPTSEATPVESGISFSRPLQSLQNQSSQNRSMPMTYSHGNKTSENKVTGSQQRETPKVGRNDPCPCGSGEKYKKCHGK